MHTKWVCPHPLSLCLMLPPHHCLSPAIPSLSAPVTIPLLANFTRFRALSTPGKNAINFTLFPGMYVSAFQGCESLARVGISQLLPVHSFYLFLFVVPSQICLLSCCRLFLPINDLTSQPDPFLMCCWRRPTRHGSLRPGSPVLSPPRYKCRRWEQC